MLIIEFLNFISATSLCKLGAAIHTELSAVLRLGSALGTEFSGRSGLTAVHTELGACGHFCAATRADRLAISISSVRLRINDPICHLTNGAANSSANAESNAKCDPESVTYTDCFKN